MKFRSILFVFSLFSFLQAQLKLENGQVLSCQDCHVTDTWKNIVLSGFDHDGTAMPLRGAHESLTCDLCHDGEDFESVHRFSDASAVCRDCHQDIHDGRNGDECSACHHTYDWQTVTDGFDHSLTGFPLDGVHRGVACSECHSDGYFATARACGLCHVQDYIGTEEHLLLKYPSDCRMCHETENWGSDFDHNMLGFSLDGAHRETVCTDCHASGFTTQNGECRSCHMPDYSAAAVDHGKAGFSDDCRMCHNTGLWSLTHWNHYSVGYALEGAHLSASCGDCHGDLYAGTDRACYSCHETDYLRPENPYHEEETFPHDCSECHTVNDWNTQVFDHLRVDFPLENGHRISDCAECHEDPPVYDISGECVDCHREDYEATSSPNHVEEHYSENCSGCHTTIRWLGASFDHSSTGFPLEGGHDLGASECETCHLGLPKDELAGAECVRCHQTDFDNTTNPDHSTEGIPTGCAVCHSIEAWVPADFDHSITDFPLTGQHTDLECAQCHTDEDYSIILQTACSSCHDASTIEGANSVWDHVSHGTVDLCENCHRTEGWLPTTFLHTDGLVCYDCHEPEYLGALDPPHDESSFPSSLCSQCHETDSWDNASFDHNQTDFPLVGAHASTACTDCHVGGKYTDMPMTCGDALCHLDDYNRTVNPSHSASGFPLDCVPCHDENAWVPSTFDHDAAFPIYSGKHNNEWDDCADCHIGGIYPDFSCTSAAGCHEHDIDRMNSKHDDVRGYTVNPPSSECLRCHPTGSEDDDKKIQPAEKPREIHEL